MKKIHLLLYLITILTSCNLTRKSAYDPGKKYSSTQLKQDFLLLQNILKANHPSIYWYTPKDSVDNLFSKTYLSFTDSLNEQQFKNTLAKTISQLRCGHTSVRPSKAYSNYYSKKTSPQFPLLLKVWADSAVVVNNLFRKDSIVKRGTIITAINGIKTGKIINSICQFISTDGYSSNFKYQVISFNFPAYYKNTFQTDSQYVVRYIDSTGLEKETVLRSYDPKTDSLFRKETFAFKMLPKRELRQLNLTGKRNLLIDSSLNTAFLSVNTFSGGNLVHFFRKSFKKIKEDKIKNVVVDLGLNSGGSVLACTRFSQYLVDKPFHVADTVAAINRAFPYKKYIKPWFIYWLSMHVSGRRKDDGRIHFNYFEHHYFKPKNKYHFNGNVYVLTGGFTFSAATLVAANLKGQKNVTLVGEETGGGFYGNTAMHITSIVLPNTGIRVSLPLFRMVLDANRQKNGRGVLPDVEVKPSSEFIKAGVDAKVEKVKDLIRGENKATLN